MLRPELCSVSKSGAVEGLLKMPVAPSDLEPDDLFHELPPASQAKVAEVLGSNDEEVVDALTSRERRAYEQIWIRREEARKEAHQRELEAHYADAPTVPQETIDALLIARARGAAKPEQGPRLREGAWWVAVLLEHENPDQVPDREKSRRNEVERAAKSEFFAEKLSARRADPSAPPEPRQHSTEWYAWIDGRELPLPPTPEPEPETGKPEEEEPGEPEHKGALVALIPEPDQTKPCWVLRSLGVTKPVRREGETKPMRGHKLILEEYEWRAGAWGRTKTRPVVPSTFNKAFAMADWIGKLPKMRRARPAMNMANLRVVLPYYNDGISRRQAAQQTGLSRRTVNKMYEILEAGAAQ